MNIPLPGGEYFSTFRVLAIDDVIDDWRESNGSVGEPVVTQLPDLNTQDSSTVTLIRYEDGERYLTAAGDERSAEVLYYMIEGGGHTWPGGGMPALFGPTNRDINASAEIWNFFSRHELPAVVPAARRLQPQRHRRCRRLRRVAQRIGNDLHASRLRRVAGELRANGRQRCGGYPLCLRRAAVDRRARASNTHSVDNGNGRPLRSPTLDFVVTHATLKERLRNHETVSVCDAAVCHRPLCVWGRYRRRWTA